MNIKYKSKARNNLHEERKINLSPSPPQKKTPLVIQMQLPYSSTRLVYSLSFSGRQHFLLKQLNPLGISIYDHCSLVTYTCRLSSLSIKSRSAVMETCRHGAGISPQVVQSAGPIMACTCAVGSQRVKAKVLKRRKQLHLSIQDTRAL